MTITNTCEKAGTPLSARHTGRPFAVPHVIPLGQPPHASPLLDEALVEAVVVLVIAASEPPVEPTLAALLAAPPPAPVSTPEPDEDVASVVASEPHASRMEKEQAKAVRKKFMDVLVGARRG